MKRARPRIFQAVGINVARLHRVVECERARVVARHVRGGPVRAAHVEDQRRIRSRVCNGLVKVDRDFDPVAGGVRAVRKRRRDAYHAPGNRRDAHAARRAERAGLAGLGQRQVGIVARNVRQVAAGRKGIGAGVPQAVRQVALLHGVVEGEHARPAAVPVRSIHAPPVQRQRQRRQRRAPDVDRLAEGHVGEQPRAGAVCAVRHRNVQHARHDPVDDNVSVYGKRRLVPSARAAHLKAAGTGGRQPAVHVASFTVPVGDVGARPRPPVQRIPRLVVEVVGIVALLDGVRVVDVRVGLGGRVVVKQGKPVDVPRLEQKPRVVEMGSLDAVPSVKENVDSIADSVLAANRHERQAGHILVQGLPRWIGARPQVRVRMRCRQQVRQRLRRGTMPGDGDKRSRRAVVVPSRRRRRGGGQGDHNGGNGNCRKRCAAPAAVPRRAARAKAAFCPASATPPPRGPRAAPDAAKQLMSGGSCWRLNVLLLRRPPPQAQFICMPGAGREAPRGRAPPSKR